MNHPVNLSICPADLVINSDLLLQQYLEYNVQTILETNSTNDSNMLVDRIGRRSIGLIMKRELCDRAHPENIFSSESGNSSSLESNLQGFSAQIRQTIENHGDLPLSELATKLCNV